MIEREFSTVWQEFYEHLEVKHNIRTSGTVQALEDLFANWDDIILIDKILFCEDNPHLDVVFLVVTKDTRASCAYRAEYEYYPNPSVYKCLSIHRIPNTEYESL